ncbi:LOW QUALITY PROTEIN: nephrin [Anser cygnoides]|uniref:LOW QUALITY PROTEIN: nephrin n=1 Tax=Anser cygnoides TaxID=8845 RepID=UPI0034D30055
MELLLALLLAGVKAAPPFVEEPSNGSAALGAEAELRCAVRGGGAVQWARGGLLLGAPPGPAHPRYRLVGDPRKGEHHLRIVGVGLEDDDVFQCQVGAGNGTTGSRPAQLRVLVPPAPPTLELPPGAELPWREGAELEVRCRAGGARPPANLLLALGGEPLPEVSSRVFEDDDNPKLSSTEVTVRVSPQRGAHGQRLVCSASNEAGGDPAEAAVTVSVLFPPEPPTIEGLESPQVRAGDTLRLACVARGGNPPPSLHWDKDGTPLAAPWQAERPAGPSQWSHWSVTGGTGPEPWAHWEHWEHWELSRSRVTLAVAPGDDGATVRCHSHSPAGGGGTASVTLRVAYPPAEVTISGGSTVAENGTLALSCTSAPSNPPVTLRWWLGGRELEPTETARIPRRRGGGTVTVTNVTLVGRRGDHGRSLRCEALSPGLGTRTAAVLLAVTHPPQEVWLEAPPPNATFRAGARLRLLCHARGGHPSPRLTWLKGGPPAARPPRRRRPRGGGPVVSRELRLTLAPSDNGAELRCAPRGRGAGTRLRVLFPPLAVWVAAAPPEPRPGQLQLLTCRAGSAHPAPRLRWLRRGHVVPGEPLPLSPGAFGGGRRGSRLRLRVALGDQGERITCEATSPPLGVAVSASHLLRLRHAPQFTEGAGAEVVALEHGGARLPLTVLAHPPVDACAWSLDGRPLRPEGSPGTGCWRGGPGDRQRVAGDAGTYGVRCHNAEGSASASLRLLVHYPPVIVRAPDPVLVDEGGAAELLCEARGSPCPPAACNGGAWVTWGGPWGHGGGHVGVPTSPSPQAEAEEGAASGELPAELQPQGGPPWGACRCGGAPGPGGAYECRVDTGVAPPARAIVRLVVRYGPELEAELGAEPGAEPGAVLVPDGADTAQLRCRAQGVPGVQLHWEHRGRALPPNEDRYQWHQWREGPWTSSVLTVTNVSLERAQHRRWDQSHNWDQYQNQPRNWTLDTFVCVAQNPLGTVRRHLKLQLADRPDPPGPAGAGGHPDLPQPRLDPRLQRGLPQSFLVSAVGPGAPPPGSILAPRPALTLRGLLPATAYDVTVTARNARGSSAPVRVTATTSELPADSPPPPGPIPAPPPSGLAAVPGLAGALGALGAGLLLGMAVMRPAAAAAMAPGGAGGPGGGEEHGGAGDGEHRDELRWVLGAPQRRPRLGPPKGGPPSLYAAPRPLGGLPPPPTIHPSGELV